MSNSNDIQSTQKKVKKPLHKKWWFWVIIVFVVFIVIGNFDKVSEKTDDTKNSTTPESTTVKEELKKEVPKAEPKEEIIEISPSKLHQEYDENAIAADEKYKNKKMKITGTITDIFRDVTGHPYISLDSGETFSHITAYFKKDEESKVAQVKKGQKVTVIGKCKGKTIYVHLKDCEFA